MLVCDLCVHEVSLIFITNYISFFLASTLISIRCVWSIFAAFLFWNVCLLWFGFNSVHFISSGQFTYLEQKQFKKMYTSKSVLWLCTPFWTFLPLCKYTTNLLQFVANQSITFLSKLQSHFIFSYWHNSTMCESSTISVKSRLSRELESQKCHGVAKGTWGIWKSPTSPQFHIWHRHLVIG